jgi:hypothetical protein
MINLNKNAGKINNIIAKGGYGQIKTEKFNGK